MRKRVIPEPLINTYVELLHHFHGRGYGLKQAIDPRRPRPEPSQRVIEAIRRGGLYDHDEARRLLAAPARRRRRAIPPAPPPSRLL